MLIAANTATDNAGGAGRAVGSCRAAWRLGGVRVRLT